MRMTALQPLCVLIVDDSPDDRAIAKTALLNGSYRRFEFVEVGLGEEALAVCARSPAPTCVLLDFHLPDMDASEVIERLRPSAGELPAIPVVVMTGSVRDPPVSALVRAGAMGFIGKDWLGPASLTRVLENALERHALFAEQQRLLQDLRAREQQLRLAQRAARLGLWDWDVVRGDVNWSDEVWNLLMPGFERGTASYDGWLRCVHADDRERVERVVRKAVKTGMPYRDEFRVVHPNGDVKWLESNGELVHDAGTTRLLGVLRDITERKLAEEATRESEARLSSILQHANACIYEMTVDSRFVHVNRYFEDTFGLKADEVRGKSVHDVFPHEIAEGFAANNRKVLSAARPLEMEELARQSDGIHTYISIKVPRYDASGNSIGVVGISTDITKRKRAEDALRESKRFLERVIDVTPGVVHVFDVPEKRSVFMNRSVAAAIGYTPDEIAAMGTEVIPRLMHPEDMPRFRDHIVRIQNLRDGEVLGFEHRMQDRMGSWHWFSSRDAVMTRNDDGTVCQIVGTSVEITELKRLELALLDADRRKDEFVATLAHELRNPLAPMRNAVQVLRLKQNAVPALQWVCDVLDRQTQHMTRLIDDVLDMNRIAQGKLDLRLRRIDLAQALEAVEMSRPTIDGQRHELAINVPADPVFVNGDLNRLVQVFANLLNNAAKYTDPGGRIELTIGARDGEASVIVKDSGIGIPTEKLRSVFTMYSQVHAAGERANGGLGIGLTLVRRVVELHGGSVEAHSEGHGKGSEFCIRLPRS
jgi:PAS domain S-box-containing protein